MEYMLPSQRTPPKPSCVSSRKQEQRATGTRTRCVQDGKLNGLLVLCDLLKRKQITRNRGMG